MGIKGKNFKELVPGFVLAAVMSFMICIFEPFQLYFTNINEFWFDITKLAPVMIIAFLIALILGCVILAVLYLIHRIAYQVALFIGSVLFLCTYIQGNYLVKDLPAMDGTIVDWSLYSKNIPVSIALYIVVIVVIALLIKKFHMKNFYIGIEVAGICMILMFSVTLVTVCMSNNGLQKKTDTVLTDVDEFEMSTDQNVVVLVLDALDSSTFAEEMNNKTEIKEYLKDFTYYKNTMSCYPFTMHSIPYILTGEWCDNTKPFEEYSTEAYKNSALFSTLEDKQYKIGVYEDEMIYNDSSISRFSNVSDSCGQISSRKQFILNELKLVAFKYLPYGLKQYSDADMSAFAKLRYVDEQSPVTADNRSFLNNLKNTGISTVEDKCFKFIHLEGAHVPFLYDANFNDKEGATYGDKVQACMTIIERYIDQLKENGVYDNSVIMIMADHGYVVEAPTAVGRQNPILLIKGIGEQKDEMTVSEAPISHEDLQTAYSKLLNGQSGNQVFDWKDGDARTRRYLYYEWLQEDCLTEYEQSGYATDLNTLLPTGVEYKLKK